jgi:hypothetical protein
MDVALDLAFQFNRRLKMMLAFIKERLLLYKQTFHSKWCFPNCVHWFSYNTYMWWFDKYLCYIVKFILQTGYIALQFFFSLYMWIEFIGATSVMARSINFWRCILLALDGAHMLSIFYGEPDPIVRTFHATFLVVRSCCWTFNFL